MLQTNRPPPSRTQPPSALGPVRPGRDQGDEMSNQTGSVRHRDFVQKILFALACGLPLPGFEQFLSAPLPKLDVALDLLTLLLPDRFAQNRMQPGIRFPKCTIFSRRFFCFRERLSSKAVSCSMGVDISDISFLLSSIVGICRFGDGCVDCSGNGSRRSITWFGSVAWGWGLDCSGGAICSVRTVFFPVDVSIHSIRRPVFPSSTRI